MNLTATFALALAAAGCGAAGRYIPPELRGDVPLTAENVWGGDVCRLWLTAPGAQSPANLLYSTLRGEIPLKVGEKATFNLKPGSYQLGVASCLDGLETSAPLSLQGPTYVGLGGRGTPPPGYAALSLSGNAGQSCTLAGGSMDDGRPCCSNRHHHDRGGLELCD